MKIFSQVTVKSLWNFSGSFLHISVHVSRRARSEATVASGQQTAATAHVQTITGKLFMLQTGVVALTSKKYIILKEKEDCEGNQWIKYKFFIIEIILLDSSLALLTGRSSLNSKATYFRKIEEWELIVPGFNTEILSENPVYIKISPGSKSEYNAPIN